MFRRRVTAAVVALSAVSAAGTYRAVPAAEPQASSLQPRLNRRHQQVLPQLPLGAPAHRWCRAAGCRCRESRCERRGLGARHREASRRLDAAAGHAAARCGDLSTPWPAGSKPRSIARGRRSPNPGRINAVHRLNRTEYNNAIRDLFALDVDVDVAAAGRRDRRRQLRQLRGRPHDFDRAPRALPVGRPPGHAARDRPASREPGARRRSRFRCTSCRTIGRAKTCRSDRAAASRSATTSRSTAST